MAGYASEILLIILRSSLFATALGLMSMYIISETDYHFWVRLAPAAYLLSMALSTAVLFVGQEINGSRRWLNLGPLSFQPSEFSKVAVILFLTWQIEKSKKKTAGFGFMCRTMMTLIPIVALVGSNNLSTAIIILGIGVIVIFVSDPGLRPLPFSWRGWHSSDYCVFGSRSYRLERLAIWRNPEKYEKGFQTNSGLICNRKWRPVRKRTGKQPAEAGICAGGSERYDLFHHL